MVKLRSVGCVVVCLIAAAAAFAEEAKPAEHPAAPVARFSDEIYTASVPVSAENADMPVTPSGFMAMPRGACPVEPDLQNYVGLGQVSVPGFSAGEEAAAILNAPASHYPIEIVAIGVGWASQFGNSGQSLEGALRLYPNGLPNPGLHQFEVEGPVLTDGAINEFDITMFPGDRIINSGPFTVSLQLGQASVPLGPAPLHDGSGCNPGQSAVFVNGTTWIDNCSLGVTGQWVIHVKYRRTDCSITDCNNNMIHDPFEIAQGLAEDCNMNGVPDDCDLANGAPDINMNGLLDECEVPCTADLDGSGTVNGGDLAILLAAWGACP